MLWPSPDVTMVTGPEGTRSKHWVVGFVPLARLVREETLR
jgi:hypothetical protein